MTEGPVEGEADKPAGYEHDDAEKYGSLEGTETTEVAEEVQEDAAEAESDG